jgi:hypothetical protein
MSGFPAQAAALNVVTRRRRRQATAAVRISIGGSPKRRFTRDRHNPRNRCCLATCRQPVLRSSLRRQDKGFGFEALRDELVRHPVPLLGSKAIEIKVADSSIRRSIYEAAQA